MNSKRWILLLGLLALLPAELLAAVNGLLKVHPTNPRWLTDNSGRAIVLTGSHTWGVFQQYENCLTQSCREGFTNVQYTGWLNDLLGWKHNFFRGWTWEDIYYYPRPYLKLSQPNASSRVYDLALYSSEWDSRLQSRVSEANNKGLYVSVMLFQGWSVSDFNGLRNPDPWPQHPYHQDHNINGIHGDTNGDGDAWELHQTPNSAFSRQADFVRHVVDLLNSYDNVIWEIANEANVNSLAWQEQIITIIRNRESVGGRKKHLIWISCTTGGGPSKTPPQSTAADLISPCIEDGNSTVQQNPKEVGPTSKVMIADSDHLDVLNANQMWAWKSFLRGYHPNFMDLGYGLTWWTGQGWNTANAEWGRIRKVLGAIQTITGQADVAGMVPQARGARSPIDNLNTPVDKNFGLFSTNRVDLTSPAANGKEYLALATGGGQSITICGLTTGRVYQVHWRHIRTADGPLSNQTAGSSCETFTNPQTNARVLHLKRL